MKNQDTKEAYEMIDDDFFKVVDLPIWSVYFLIKDGSAIYVGCTGRIEQRIKTHKLTKDFDSYTVIKTFDDKYDAHMCERQYTLLFYRFGNNNLLNKIPKHIDKTMGVINI